MQLRKRWLQTTPSHWKKSRRRRPGRAAWPPTRAGKQVFSWLESPFFVKFFQNATKPFALQPSFYYNGREITVAGATKPPPVQDRTALWTTFPSYNRLPFSTA